MDEWLDERFREKLVERFGDRLDESRASNISVSFLEVKLNAIWLDF